MYSSARLMVRLGPTPGYKHPVSDDSFRVENGAPEGVVVAHHAPRYLSRGYGMSSIGHTQFEHHIMERVDALSSEIG